MSIQSVLRKMNGGMPARTGRGLLLLAVALSLTGAKKGPYGPHDKAFFASQPIIDFLRPGLVITINSASIGADGTITATYTLTDPVGLPLDAAGVYTPGPITISLVAAYIPEEES
jgi:hypothetical protein